MKVLFVTDYLLAPYGGAQNSAKAHLYSLSQIVGKENVTVIALNHSKTSDVQYKWVTISSERSEYLKNIICGNIPFIPDKFNRVVFNELRNAKYDVLFLDNSWFGKIAKYAKQMYPNLRIVTNFHGVKKNSNIEKIKRNPYRWQSYLEYYACYKNEKTTITYSDCLLLLNDRDNSMLDKYYQRKADLILPVYFIDTSNIVEYKDDSFFNILFVGGALEANIKGIKWFIRNVLPGLDDDVRLYVVGNTMERLNYIDNLDKRVVAVGRVNCLDEYYNMANVVIGPIFEGDGMKTKTAEALMYGKVYLGTDEALQGYYGLDGYRCNTSQDFIKKIRQLKDSKCKRYSQEMKDIFLKYHSATMADTVFRKAISFDFLERK